MRYREVITYKHYFEEFLAQQNPKVQEKILLILHAVEEMERIPVTYLKYLEGTDGLFEIRVGLGSNIFRVFCFFDAGQLVVLLTGFQKKTQKTPKKEIERAERLKIEYYKEKERDYEGR